MPRSSEDALVSLRRSFFLIAVGTATLLIGMVLLSINLVNYRSCFESGRTVLEAIVQNGGTFPSADVHDDGKDDGDEKDEGDASDALDDMFGNEESASQLRYFSVTFDDEGNVVDMDVDHTTTFDAESATELARSKLGSRKELGHFVFDGVDYMYYRSSTDDGIIVAVVNCYYEFHSFKMVRIYSLWLGSLFIVAFAIIVMLLTKRAVEPFERSIRSQRQFITNAGHELKTPLAIIRGNAEFLEMANGKSEWTQSILKQTTRLSTLVNRLIALARLQEWDAEKYESLDMSSVVREAAESFRVVVEQGGKSFDADVRDGVRVTAEPRALQELVNILLDNANKYCDEGGKVGISLAKTRTGRARLVVNNTYAEGRDVDYTSFFDRFYRQDTSHNSEKEGFGIGLSMAAQIVQNFKGTIRVEYAEPAISFVVTL